MLSFAGMGCLKVLVGFEIVLMDNPCYVVLVDDPVNCCCCEAVACLGSAHFLNMVDLCCKKDQDNDFQCFDSYKQCWNCGHQRGMNFQLAIGH